jgi:hypothetical protein
MRTKIDRSLFEDTRSLVSNWAVAEGPFSELRTRLTVHPNCSDLKPDFDSSLQRYHAVKKFSKLGGYDQAKKNAFLAFHEREKVNRLLNRTLHFTAPSHLRKARELVKYYLGPFNKQVLDDVVSRCYFGPGVCRGSRNDELSKARSLTITEELLPFGPALLAETGLFRLLHGFDGPASAISDRPFCIDNAKLACVPKDELMARTITIEPALNSFLQNGCGEYLRKRLRRLSRRGRAHGFNLYNQSINQSLAVYPNATLDLSNASNSLSIRLVELLLPPDWFHFLNLIRSHRYIDTDGTITPFQLFCGMGNGFCFALQTIIFASLVRAASDRESCLAVYGDDIIVSPHSVLSVISLFESVGLVINLDKSHYCPSDYYRESCGVHTYHGRVVTPTRFIWSEGDDLRVRAIAFHNGLLLQHTRRGFCSRSSLSICYALRRYFSPVGLVAYGSSDLAFWACLTRRRSTYILRPVIKSDRFEDSSHGYFHALLRKLRPSVNLFEFDPLSVGNGPGASHERYTVRTGFRGMALRRVRARSGVYPFVVLDSL